MLTSPKKETPMHSRNRSWRLLFLGSGILSATLAAVVSCAVLGESSEPDDLAAKDTFASAPADHVEASSPRASSGGVPGAAALSPEQPTQSSTESINRMRELLSKLSESSSLPPLDTYRVSRIAWEDFQVRAEALRERIAARSADGVRAHWADLKTLEHLLIALDERDLKALSLWVLEQDPTSNFFKILVLALGRRNDATPVTQILVSILDSEDASLVRLATMAVGRMPATGVPEVDSALDETELLLMRSASSERGDSLFVPAQKVGETYRQSILRLIRESTDKSVLYEAFAVLGKMFVPEEELEVLRSRLGEETAIEDRAPALAALLRQMSLRGREVPPELVDLVRETLGSGRIPVELRHLVVDSLGTRAGDALRETLLQQALSAEDTHPGQRQAAVRALGRFPSSPTTRDALLRIASDEGMPSSVRVEAVGALSGYLNFAQVIADLGDVGEAAIQLDPAVAVAVLMTLVEGSAQPRATNLAEKCLRGRDRTLVHAALVTLRSARNRVRSIQAIESAISSLPPELAEEAATTLAILRQGQ